MQKNDFLVTENDLILLKQIYAKKLPKILEKIKKGYPVQYAIGYVDFYNNKIKVNKYALIPRFETELLVEKLIKRIKNKIENPIILEVGTGTGCIAISLKKEISTANITAIDISKKAIKLAKENAIFNKTNITFVEADFNRYESGKYDIIVSNPPYIAYDEEISLSVKKFEPSKALYAPNNGLYFYDLILKKSLTMLSPKGLIAFEIGCTQSEQIFEIAKKYYPNCKIEIEKDYNDKERFIFIYIE